MFQWRQPQFSDIHISKASVTEKHHFIGNSISGIHVLLVTAKDDKGHILPEYEYSVRMY